MLPQLIRATRLAGQQIMDIQKRSYKVSIKADSSPVTEADQAAEDIILEILERVAPGVPLVAEEQSERDGLIAVPGDLFFLIDPLDGTKSFIKGDDSYTVNIALIHKQKPILAVVGVPAMGAIYWGLNLEKAGKITWRGTEEINRSISTRKAPASGLTVVASVSHLDAKTEAYIKHFNVADHQAVGSSLKFCLLAEAKADLYPRFGPTREWDTAAGQGVLMAAGGQVYHPDNSSFLYNKKGFLNGPFVAVGDPSIALPNP